LKSSLALLSPADQAGSLGITGLKNVKRLAFVMLAAGLLAATPALAQMGGGPGGLDFVEAVKKSDGDKAIQILASRPKGIVNSKDGDGNTGLIIAISRSDEQWTGYLLNQGADPNVPGKGGDTPLIAAARVGFTEAVQWLIAIGAKVDAANRMGETPLIIAVQQRELPIVRQLLDAGANPDRTDSAAGYSARDYAARDMRARDILKLIDDKKPKPAK
jgi:ankyrin repeat protein